MLFQEFGIRKFVKHVIDPSVIIQIEESAMNCPPEVKLTGMLFGKQMSNNLVITYMCPLFVGNLKTNNEGDLDFKFNDNLETMVRYYENVYSLKAVGMFALKEEYDRESTIQLSNIFKFKSTQDFIYLKVNYDESALKFNYEAFVPMKNVLFQDILIFNQKVPIKVEFVGHSFSKGQLNSHSRHFLRRELPGSE